MSLPKLFCTLLMKMYFQFQAFFAFLYFVETSSENSFQGKVGENSRHSQEDTKA